MIFKREKVTYSIISPKLIELILKEFMIFKREKTTSIISIKIIAWIKIQNMVRNTIIRTIIMF